MERQKFHGGKNDCAGKRCFDEIWMFFGNMQIFPYFSDRNPAGLLPAHPPPRQLAWQPWGTQLASGLPAGPGSPLQEPWLPVLRHTAWEQVTRSLGNLGCPRGLCWNTTLIGLVWSGHFCLFVCFGFILLFFLFFFHCCWLPPPQVLRQDLNILIPSDFSPPPPIAKVWLCFSVSDFPAEPEIQALIHPEPPHFTPGKLLLFTWGKSGSYQRKKCLHLDTAIHLRISEGQGITNRKNALWDYNISGSESYIALP